MILLFSSCKDGPLAVGKITTGSQVNILDGTMEEKSLEFFFKEPKKQNTSSDIFNFIYFEGDTLCFSYTLTQRLYKSQAAVFFINPQTGEAFPVERLEVYRYRIYGFTLVGSILEKFYHPELKKKPPADKWCCREIPFIIEARFRNRDESITHRHRGSFRITYRKQS